MANEGRRGEDQQVQRGEAAEHEGSWSLLDLLFAVAAVAAVAVIGVFLSV